MFDLPAMPAYLSLTARGENVTTEFAGFTLRFFQRKISMIDWADVSKFFCYFFKVLIR